MKRLLIFERKVKFLVIITVYCNVYCTQMTCVTLSKQPVKKYVWKERENVDDCWLGIGNHNGDDI